MLSPDFATGMHRTALARRATVRNDSQVVVSLRNGSVLLSAAEWRHVRARFDRLVAPVARRTRWVTLALLPGILVFGMTLGQVLPYAGVLILVTMFGSPIAIYLWHSRTVQKIAAVVDDELSGYSPCPPAARRSRRLPRWFELAFLLLVGPGLLLSIIGEIGGPDLFCGTPWWGAGMGTLDWVALALIGVRVSWPLLRRGPQRWAIWSAD